MSSVKLNQLKMKHKFHLPFWGLFFLTLIYYSNAIIAQDLSPGFIEYQEKSQQTDRYGMYTLGGWAIGNIAYGTYGWLEYTGEKKYFNQMNTLWNTVNVGLAVYGLLNSNHSTANEADFVSRNKRMENHSFHPMRVLRESGQ